MDEEKGFDEEDNDFLQQVSEEEEGEEGEEGEGEEAKEPSKIGERGKAKNKEQEDAEAELKGAKDVLETDAVFRLDDMEAFLDAQDEAAMQLYAWQDKQHNKQRTNRG